MSFKQGYSFAISVVVFMVLTNANPAQATPGRGVCFNCHSRNPAISTTPANGSTLDFGNVLVGESKGASLSVTNTVSRSGLLGSFPAVSGEFGPANTAAFTTDYSGQVISGRTYSRTYTYTPTVRGADSRNITVASTNGGGSSTILFSGKGVAPLAHIDTRFANAGNVRIGTSAPLSLGIHNLGDGNLAGAGKGNLTGRISALAGKFAGDGGSFSLADLAAQSFAFSYSPTTHGRETAWITVNFDNGNPDGTNLPGSPSLLLAGAGVGPVFASSAAPLDTLDLGPAQDKPAQFRLTISNLTADAPVASLTDLTLLSATISGSDATLFSLSGLTPGMVLSKSQTADLLIAFAPSGPPGPRHAALTLLTDQDAPLGAAGRSFSYNLAATVVPEPASTIGLLVVASFVLAGRRTHR